MVSSFHKKLYLVPRFVFIAYFPLNAFRRLSCLITAHVLHIESRTDLGILEILSMHHAPLFSLESWKSTFGVWSTAFTDASFSITSVSVPQIELVEYVFDFNHFYITILSYLNFSPFHHFVPSVSLNSADDSIFFTSPQKRASYAHDVILFEVPIKFCSQTKKKRKPQGYE